MKKRMKISCLPYKYFCSYMVAAALLVLSLACDDRGTGAGAGAGPGEVQTWRPNHPGPGTTEDDAGPDFRDAGTPRPRRDASVDFADGGEEIFNPPAPHIDVVEPASGPTAGGTRVTLRGTGFFGTASTVTVAVGGQPCVDVDLQSQITMFCKTPRGTAGPADVVVTTPYGSDTKVGGYLYYVLVSLASVAPDRGPTTGGTAVTLTGEGFVAGSIVSFGGQTALSVSVVSEQTITAVTPERAVAGPVEVRVAGPFGAARKADGFTYVTKVRITGVTPASGPVAGGTTVTVAGEGFSPVGSTVKFGATSVNPVTIAADGKSLTAVTPAASAAGLVDVGVDVAGDLETLIGAFAYVDTTATTFGVNAVVPAFGPATGGNTITVTGAGFDGAQATTVTMGGADCASLTVVDANTIQCTAPAHAAGLVDVAIANGATSATLTQVYRFVAAVVVSAVVPARGPASGGTPVTITGSGFTGATSVKFGAMAATSFSVSDDATILATSPAGAGVVSVSVSHALARGELANAFTYDEAPVVVWVEPNRGAIAGGTYVAISGRGFDSATAVTFGVTPLVATQVVGPSLIVGRTPAHAVGTVDVAATSPNGASVKQQAYTYYDPFRPNGGNGGGPIEGAVNVTVLNGDDGSRVDGAFVMLRTAATTPYKGTTNTQGQVTLSGADVYGEQVVTASKAGFAAGTVNAVNARDVDVILMPIPDPQPGPMPPGQGGIIRGRVQAFGKDVPGPRNQYEFKAVFVATTQRNMFRANPNPGPGASMIDTTNSTSPVSFDYEIVSRTGDVAVVAIAGLYDTRPADQGGIGFTPFVFGIHRYLFVGNGQELNNINVDMKHRLLVEANFRMIDPPPLAPAGPTEYQVVPYLDFGGEGVFTWTMGTGPGPDFRIDKLPDRVGDLAGLTYIIWARAYNDGYVPYSYYFLWSVNDTNARIDIGPMVDIPQAQSPLPGDAPVGRRFAWTAAGAMPSINTGIILKPAFPAPIPIWMITQPGNVKEFTLPDLVGAGGPTPFEATVTQYYWAVVPELGAATFNFNDYTMNQLAGEEVKGYAANAWLFQNR